MEHQKANILGLSQHQQYNLQPDISNPGHCTQLGDICQVSRTARLDTGIVNFYLLLLTYIDTMIKGKCGKFHTKVCPPPLPTDESVGNFRFFSKKNFEKNMV